MMLKLMQLQEPFSGRMEKDRSCDLGPPVHSWGSWSGTKELEPWKKTLVGPLVYFWGSWSGDSGKVPMEPEATFMQVIINMVASQRAMTQSLAQMADRLAIVGTPGTQAPHAAQGNSGVGSRPQSPTRTYTSSSRVPRPLFPDSKGHPQ
jgi:hypothetical protein